MENADNHAESAELDPMTETEFREKAANYRYSTDEIDGLVRYYRGFMLRMTGEPTPYENIPLVYKGY